MSDHTARVHWQRQQQPFVDRRYSRCHSWHFDGGTEVPASPSPHIVRPPMSDPAGVDPEEAFVAALASCHLLWFLDLAAQAGWVVDDYADDAVGVLARNADGQLAITVVTLRPAVRFGGERRPSRDEQTRLHHAAHAQCFIANSVRSDVRCEPVWVD